VQRTDDGDPTIFDVSYHYHGKDMDMGIYRESKQLM
jgi:hypothetical protein